MSSNVMDLSQRRALRDFAAQLQAAHARQAQAEFESDPELARRVAKSLLCEHLLRYRSLIDHLRGPLLEAVELALLVEGDDDYCGAMALVLRDHSHVGELAKRVKARADTLSAEHTRLDAAGLLLPKDT